MTHRRPNGALEGSAQAYRVLGVRIGRRTPKERGALRQSTALREPETRKLPAAVLQHAMGKCAKAGKLQRFPERQQGILQSREWRLFASSGNSTLFDGEWSASTPYGIMEGLSVIRTYRRGWRQAPQLPRIPLLAGLTIRSR